jgi:hypothetical protein
MQIAQERVQILSSAAELQKSVLACKQGVQQSKSLLSRGVVAGGVSLVVGLFTRAFRRDTGVVDAFLSPKRNKKMYYLAKCAVFLLTPWVRRKWKQMAALPGAVRGR